VYVKASSRKTKDGQVIRYLQLAHNEWDAAAGVSRTKILHSFGREDELDKDAVRRLVAALSRLLDPAGAVAATTPGELTISGSRPLGGTHVLDGLPAHHRARPGQAGVLPGHRPAEPRSGPAFLRHHLHLLRD
jgi:hypothetical protein